MHKILVVEDHAVTREPLVKLLTYEGFFAIGAANGQLAMEALLKERVDLVLLDCMMPKMDGLAFLKTLRADSRFAALPVIVLTGLPESSHLDRIREFEVADVIQKAKFGLPHLFDRVRACLSPAA